MGSPSPSRIAHLNALYSKLYSNYDKLKTQKFSELEQQFSDQDHKFVNYKNVVNELNEHVKSENEQLRSQVDDLQCEIASLRSAKDEQCSEYQKLFMEENMKNKELSEEVTKLQKMLQAETCRRMKGSNTENEDLCMSSGGEVSGEAGNSSKRKDTNKHKRCSESETRHIDTPSGSHDETVIPRESAKDIHKKAVPREVFVISHKTNVNRQPQCCRNLEGSGGSVSITSNRLFQELLEYMLGLKFTIVHQTEEACISAKHQSSGYSFTLTWVNSATGKEPELHYRCLSLGTFERVAPEWMTEELIFSTTMVPIFFGRVSRVVRCSS